MEKPFQAGGGGWGGYPKTNKRVVFSQSPEDIQNSIKDITDTTLAVVWDLANSDVAAHAALMVMALIVRMPRMGIKVPRTKTTKQRLSRQGAWHPVRVVVILVGLHESHPAQINGPAGTASYFSNATTGSRNNQLSRGTTTPGMVVTTGSGVKLSFSLIHLVFTIVIHSSWWSSK